MAGTILKMNFKVKLAVAFISISPCLGVGAKAMAPEDFARMNNDDEATFVTMLVEGSAQVLKAHGQPDQAAKAVALFRDPGKDGGVSQFAANLKMVNAVNKRNAINPNNRAPVLQVEDAMELTLKGAGIIVPTSALLAISRDFRPIGPPRQHNYNP